MTPNSTPESQPPQKRIDSEFSQTGKLPGLTYTEWLEKQNIQETTKNTEPASAEDKEFTALREYIFDNGFVVSTVAFHIVTLCAQPMVTPATTNWDFKDRALIPDMVFTLLKQPGYLEGIWPSLRIIMGTNKGNAAWCSAIAMTLAFFDVIKLLPVHEELRNDS